MAALALIADQLSKRWAVDELATRTIELVGSLRLNLTYNSGVAFSIGPGKGQLVGVVAVGIVAVVLWSERHDTTVLGAVARGLIVGGALGNLFDRLFRAHDGFLTGRVVDFIDLQWWPVFNVADAAVVVGCILLVAVLVLRSPGQSGPVDGVDDEHRAAAGDRDRVPAEPGRPGSGPSAPDPES